jgi:hypothetical protein
LSWSFSFSGKENHFRRPRLFRPNLLMKQLIADVFVGSADLEHDLGRIALLQDSDQRSQRSPALHLWTNAWTGMYYHGFIEGLFKRRLEICVRPCHSTPCNQSSDQS